MSLKPDAAAIAAVIEGLATASWLGSARAAWPNYLFRIENLPAAINIIQSGKLYSRRKAEKLGLIEFDTASAAVIEVSPEWCKQCVRLYFRPKTPTEYRSEGFRPKDKIELSAHRPAPVVFLFDSQTLLMRDGTLFTSGNAAKQGCKRGGDAKFLQSIPFQKVYHIGPIAGSESEKRQIVFHRCAEVLIPDELNLDSLKHAYCRSDAEYETLMNGLSPSARSKYGKRIGVSAKFHLNLWTFVEHVDLLHDEVRFMFNPSTATPGPFDAEIQFTDLSGRLLGTWRNSAFEAQGAFTISLANLQPMTSYVVTLTLDGLLAYRNVFVSDEALV
jgi:hypothetical protein